MAAKPIFWTILRRFALSFLLTSTVLFGSAGTFHWWNAWILLFFSTVVSLLAWNLFQKSPGLLEERLNAAKKAKPWDRVLGSLVGFFLPVLALILAGLDHRWGWTRSINAMESLLAAPVMAGGMLTTYWAMRTNPFFSSYVRIQKDRGHKVVQAGPYRSLRHPGYTGIILYNLGAPILLGSLAAFGVGMAVFLLMIVRTVLEDRTLRKELKGYAKYASKVRYKLVPYVW